MSHCAAPRRRVNFYMRHDNLERRAFLVVVVLTTVGFLWMVHEFLMPVFWAVVLAVLFRPAFQRWLKIVRGRASLAAGLTAVT